MKNTILIILTLIMFSCKKESNFEKQIKWSNFYFKSDSVSGKYYEKLAMFVPVTFENDTTQYEMQFDLGADMSQFYEIPLREIKSVSSKIDTFNTNQYSIKNQLYLDNKKSQISEFPIMKDWGEKGSKIIGTIGANEFKNKILVIDYPNEKFVILDSTSIDFKNSFNLVEYIEKKGFINLKLKIENSYYNFLFDTGSSTTPLATTIPLYEKFTGKNKIDIDTIRVPSWGINVVSPGAKNIYAVEIESIKLKSNQRVYGTDAEHILQFFKEEQIDGLISNPYFFDNIIMIDFKNKLFGVKR